MNTSDPVTLREITFETVRSIVSLTVKDKQQSYVASNAVSIAEAHFNPGAWFRAIYANETPVGFVMLFDPSVSGALARGPVASDEVALWRLMIDHNYQRMGYGKEALDLVCTHVRKIGNAQKLLSSYVAGSDGPEGFYLGYGFRKTGRFRSNGQEVEILLPLFIASQTLPPTSSS